MKKKDKKEQKKKKKRAYTPWHVYFADALSHIVSPKDMKVICFDKLGTAPLESDIFIILMKNKKDLIKSYSELNFMIPYLVPERKPGILFEFKEVENFKRRHTLTYFEA